MIQVKIRSVAELIDSARTVFSGFGRTTTWFRGQSSSSWSLVPLVHRQYDRHGEHSLAARFLLAAPTRYEPTPDLEDLSGWLCLMQHFGLPTRLLDWSASPLVALYFAVNSGPCAGDAAVWGMVPSGLNAKSMASREETFVLSGPEARALVVAALRQGSPIDDVLAVVAQDIDLRMAVQQGAFSLHGTDQPMESRTGADRYLAKLVIPHSAIAALQEELWFLGIRRASLFPDLTNLAIDLCNDHRLIPIKTVT